VVPGGPTANAGIQVGDIITEVAGQPATSIETLIALAPRSVPATL
jgi:S1-C subfamily serine protease